MVGYPHRGYPWMSVAARAKSTQLIHLDRDFIPARSTFSARARRRGKRTERLPNLSTGQPRPFDLGWLEGERSPARAPRERAEKPTLHFPIDGDT